MKIKSVNKFEYYLVETDCEDEEHMFRRDVAANSKRWEVLMGESWEQTYGNIELEEAFQEWLSLNAI